MTSNKIKFMKASRKYNPVITSVILYFYIVNKNLWMRVIMSLTE